MVVNFVILTISMVPIIQFSRCAFVKDVPASTSIVISIRRRNEDESALASLFVLLPILSRIMF